MFAALEWHTTPDSLEKFYVLSKNQHRYVQYQYVYVCIYMAHMQRNSLSSCLLFLQVHVFICLMCKFFICSCINSRSFSRIDDMLLVYYINYINNVFMFHYDSWLFVHMSLHSSINDSSVANTPSIRIYIQALSLVRFCRPNWVASSKNWIQPWEENIRSLRLIFSQTSADLREKNTRPSIILGKFEKKS